MTSNWTPRADAWLRDLYPNRSNKEIAQLLGRSYSAIKNRAAVLGLKKSAEHMAQKPGCFTKDDSPWNKGMKWNPGERCKATQFKPGDKPKTWVPVGTETMDADGYLKRKIRDDAPVGMSRKNWAFVHVLAWEQHNGRPVPEKHIVRFKDGNKQNLDPDNLALVSMAENALLNRWLSVPNPPDYGFDVLLTLAKIQLVANKRKREAA